MTSELFKLVFIYFSLYTHFRNQNFIMVVFYFIYPEKNLNLTSCIFFFFTK